MGSCREGLARTRLTAASRRARDGADANSTDHHRRSNHQHGLALGEALHCGYELFGVLLFDRAGQMIDPVTGHVVIAGCHLLILHAELITSLMQGGSQCSHDARSTPGVVFQVDSGLAPGLTREPGGLLLRLTGDNLAQVGRHGCRLGLRVALVMMLVP